MNSRQFRTAARSNSVYPDLRFVRQFQECRKCRIPPPGAARFRGRGFLIGVQLKITGERCGTSIIQAFFHNRDVTIDFAAHISLHFMLILIVVLSGFALPGIRQIAQ